MTQDCVDKVRSEYKLNLSREEVDSIRQDVDDFIEAKGGKQNVDRAAAGRFVKDKAKAEAINKNIKIRNAAYNKLRVQEIEDIVDDIMASKRKGQKFVLLSKDVGYADAFRSVMVGMEAVNSNSVMSVYEGRFATYTGKLAQINDIGENTMKRFVAGEMDQGVYRALDELHSGKRKDYDTPITTEEREVAKVLNDTFTAIKSDLNRNGAFIGELDMAWAGKQVHDADLIRPKKGESREAAFNRWREFVYERLDWEKTHGVTREEYLGSVETQQRIDRYWDDLYESILSGHYGSPSDAQRGAGSGSRSQARSVSHERKIHFRDMDSFMEYQKQYGVPTLYDSVLRHARSSARASAILRKLGPNYQQNIEKAIDNKLDMLHRNRETEQAETLRKFKSKELPHLLDEVDGSAEVPDSKWLSKFAAYARKLQSWSLLGGTSITMANDVPNIMREAHFQGANGLEAASQWFSSAVNIFGDTSDKRAAAQSLGVVMDVMSPSRIDSFESAFDGVNKTVTKVDNAFRRASLFTGITERTRQDVSLFYSAYVGQNRDVSFDKLDRFMREVMEVAGFDEADWDILRAAVRDVDFQGETRPIMDLDALLDVDDATINAHLEKKGVASTPLMRRRALDNITDKWVAYINDTVKSAQIEAKPETRYMMRLKTQAGTPAHAALSLIMQFKTYPLSFARQRLGRDISFRRNVLANMTEEQKRHLSLFQSSPVYATATLVVNLTLMGYLVQTVKSALNNETPQDPRDPKVMLAAFLQGGGAALYGEFLFSRTSRYGGSALTGLLGPSARTIDGIQELISAAAWGDKTASQQLEAAVRLVHSHLPGQNLFYAKAIMNMLIFDRMYNAIRENSVDERKERMMEERGTSRIFE